MVDFQEINSERLTAAGGTSLAASGNVSFKVSEENIKKYGMPNSALVTHNGVASQIDVIPNGDVDRTKILTASLVAVELEPEDKQFSAIQMINRDATNAATINIIARWLKMI